MNASYMGQGYTPVRYLVKRANPFEILGVVAAQHGIVEKAYGFDILGVAGFWSDGEFFSYTREQRKLFHPFLLMEGEAVADYVWLLQNRIIGIDELGQFRNDYLQSKA